MNLKRREPRATDLKTQKTVQGRIFTCVAHSDEDVDSTIEAAQVAFKKAKEIR